MKKLAKKSTKEPYKPKPERDIPRFKKNTRWVMIIEYRPGVVDRQYQKFTFKTETGGMKAAVKEAERQARIVGKAICVSIKEIQEDTLCRVVAVYADDVFKSWEKEVGTDLSKDHIKKAKKIVELDRSKREIKKVGRVKVR